MNRISLFVAWIALLAAPLGAQQQPTAVVLGTVVAEGREELLPFATVTLLRVGRTTTTDHRGRFRFSEVTPHDSLLIRVRLLGYRPAEQRISLVAGDTVRLRIRLTATALVLSTVRTTGSQDARARFEQVPNVGAIAMSSRELAAVPPLAERDVMRAVQLLPGVASRSDYSAGYSVRGGEMDQNLILLDGIPIYNPSHLYGLFSTFPDGTVGSAELLTGAFTAEHGGRLSSVLDITSASDPRPGVHGQVAFSLLAASATLGGSLPGFRTTWSASARRTYADRLASAVTDLGFPYYFRDEHVHVSHQLTSGGRLLFTAYDGSDNLAGLADADTLTQAETVQHQWGNSAAGITWLQPIGERLSLKQRASITRFSSRLDDGQASRVVSNRVIEWRVAGSLDARVQSHQLAVGYEYARHLVRFRDVAPKLTATLQSFFQSSFSTAAFLEDNWRVSEQLILRPGIRVEGVSIAKWVGVSPRISLKYFVRPDFALTGAAARHAQWMHSLRHEDVSFRAFELWTASNRDIPVATANHLVAGFEAIPGSSSRLVRAEAFWKGYSNLTEPDPADDPSRQGDEVRSIEGGVYGVDLFLRQLEGERAGGWIAYTYSVATRRQGSQRFFPTQDRRHNLNVVGSYRGPRQLRFSGHLGFATGTPYTPIVGEIVRRSHDPVTGYWETGVTEPETQPLGTTRNGGRLPLYHRVDLGVERTFRKGDARITPSLHLINLYNRQNVFSYLYDYQSTPPTREAVSQLPLLPTIGLTVAF